jgi:hypothetical protein
MMCLHSIDMTRQGAAAAIGFALALAGVISAQTDVTRLGPQVGQAAPAFQLADQLGRTQSLKTVAGPKGTMLVFFRSADW